MAGSTLPKSDERRPPNFLTISEHSCIVLLFIPCGKSVASNVVWFVAAMIFMTPAAPAAEPEYSFSHLAGSTGGPAFMKGSGTSALQWPARDGARFSRESLRRRCRKFNHPKAEKSGTSGIVLLEVYDADVKVSGSNFANIATRAYSTAGNGVTLGGFVISGNA